MPRQKKTAKKKTKKKRQSPSPAVHPKNRLNELTGDRWMWFTKSIVTTTYPMEFGHKLRRAHGANKPPRLMQEQIEYFTKRDGVVLDPFAGVGGTLSRHAGASGSKSTPNGSISTIRSARRRVSRNRR
jgi:DNA modification methylase